MDLAQAHGFQKNRGMDGVKRFSGRVEDYRKFRPSYPEEMIAFLVRLAALRRGSVVVDVGSGTGISAKPFLELGCEVYGVEPNEAMRVAAEDFLATYPGFRSVDGRAEHTGVPSGVADIVFAAQAFHWFDREKASREFARVLKPGGTAAVIWNNRRVSGSDFAVEYEAFIRRHATDYEKVNHQNVERTAIREFLGNGGYGEARFENAQHLNFDGLLGRLTSSSYMPNTGEPGFERMRKDLQILFDRHQKAGAVMIAYDTELFYATTKSSGEGRKG